MKQIFDIALVAHTASHRNNYFVINVIQVALEVHVPNCDKYWILNHTVSTVVFIIG